MRKAAVGFTCLLLAALLAVPARAQAPDAKQTIEAQVGKILNILRDPAVKSQPEEVKKDKVRGLINAVFDYHELSRRTLGRNWKKLNADQQKEFEDLFGKLLEKVYMGRILQYTDEKVVFGKLSPLRKNRVEVQSKIVTSDGREIPIFYRMIEKGGSWRVYDVVIEGVSMVKNYRGQFKQILAKKTPDQLLETLRKKVSS